MLIYQINIMALKYNFNMTDCYVIKFSQIGIFYNSTKHLNYLKKYIDNYYDITAYTVIKTFP